MSPFFSIAVTTYDRVELLRETLESILAQTYGDFEILVGNDNQNRKIRQCFPDINDDRIRWIDNPINLGYVKNFNSLLRLSRGKYFTSLSDDDTYFPNYLKIMHRAVTKFGQIPVAYSAYIHGKSIPSDIDFKNSFIRLYSGKEWLNEYLSKKLLAIGCYGVFERQFIRKIGGTYNLGSDPFFSPYNDNLLVVQSALAQSIAYCPDPLVFYRLHCGSPSYISKCYATYSSAQKDFLILAEEIFSLPVYKNQSRTYRGLLLAWFINDFFNVMKRGQSRPLKDITAYVIFILSNIHTTKNKIQILANLKSGILSLFPHLLSIKRIILHSIVRFKQILFRF